jgi:hypothetical protein
MELPRRKARLKYTVMFVGQTDEIDCTMDEK